MEESSDVLVHWEISNKVWHFWLDKPVANQGVRQERHFYRSVSNQIMSCLLSNYFDIS